MGFELETDLVVIISSNVAGKISDRYADRIAKIMGGDYEELDERLLGEYAGSYRLASGAEIGVRFDENDSLLATYRAKELVGLLAASGKEVKEEVERFDRRTGEMLNSALAGDFAALAAAWGQPLEGVKARASAFWGAKKRRWGESRGLEVMGTLARPGTLFTYIRVDFEKGSGFFTYIWDRDSGRLQEMRESENLERQFEPKSKNEFVSPAIGATIVFEKDDKGEFTLIIKKGGTETRAKKAAASGSPSP
jgi:hypothetical protein